MTNENDYPTHVDQIDPSDVDSLPTPVEYVHLLPYTPRPIMVKYLSSSLRAGTDLEQRLQGFIELHLKRITGLWAGLYRDTDTRELLNPTSHVTVVFDENPDASFQGMLEEIMGLNGSFDLLFVEPDRGHLNPVRVWRATLEPLQSGIFTVERDLAENMLPIPELSVNLAPIPDTRFAYNAADDVEAAKAWFVQMATDGLNPAPLAEPTTES